MLELFVDSEEPLTSSEVARRLRVPRTTALRILMTLCEQGLLSRHGNGFMPGSKLFRLGIRALSSLRLRKFGTPILQQLAQRTGETTQLVTLSGTQALVLDVCEGPRLVRIAQGPGALLPLHCTAAGKVMLAFTLRARLEPIVAQGLETRTPNTLTTLAELEAELDRIIGSGMRSTMRNATKACAAWPPPSTTPPAAPRPPSASSPPPPPSPAARTSTSPRTSSGPPAELSSAMGHEPRPPLD